MNDIHGMIWAERDEAPGVEEKLGSIRASFVHMDRAYNDGESLFEIFDSIVCARRPPSGPCLPDRVVLASGRSR